MRLAPIAQVGGDDLEAAQANGVPSGRGARRRVLQNPHSSIETQDDACESSPGLDEAKQALLHPTGDTAESPALARVRRLHAHATAADLEGQSLADAGDTGAETPNQPEGHLLSQDEGSNFSQALSEAARDGDSTIVPLDPEVLEMFKAQCNRDLLVRVTRYARRLAAAVADLGGCGGDALAEDLVQEALLDTRRGVLRWDPAAASLELHLTSRIRSRARDERRRAVAYPHVSLSTPAKEEDEGLSPLEEAEAVLSVQQEAEARAQRVRRRGALKKLIAEDPDVRAIVRAVEDGSKTKADILRVTGLSAREYRNARDRLGYMKRQMVGGEDEDYSVAGGRSDQEERASKHECRG